MDALGAQPFYFTPPKSNQPPEIGELEPLIVDDGASATNLEIGPPRDADNDGLTIEVMGLPTFGAMESGDEVVDFGDVLTIEELQALTYRPTKGEIGEAGAFLFVVRDGKGGVTAGRVPIDVVRSNKVPLVAEARDIVWPEVPLGIEAPTDPDGDPLSITVLTVPTLGEIKNGEETLSVGDNLSVEALTSLMLDPSSGSAGEFAYEVADDHGGVSRSSLNLRLPGPAGVADIVADSETDTLTTAASAENLVTSSETADPQMRNTTPESDDVNEVASVAPTMEVEEANVSMLETLTASNIRGAPGADAEWITSVTAGTQLRILEKVRDKDWYQIEMADGRTGFISGSLIRIVESEPVEMVAVDDVSANQPSKPEPTEEREVEIAAINPTSQQTDEFSECENCPTMVALPIGRFQMGSTDGERSEQPVREVAIERPIAIGKYEVTVAEWQSCASAGFCRKIADPEPGDDKRPVQNISWVDAESFVAWLRAETEMPYRLPTEAEWEYAARGGKQTKFWWGDTYEGSLVNCAECGGDWDRKRPSDIGSYQPNPFGIHDMLGGVSEWVADCWINDYQDAPDNGAARSLSFCPQRVLRGGSWRSGLADVTTSSRFQYDAQVSYYTNGFRVARDLE